MTCYHLTWEIDLDADTPEEAARKALAIQRDPTSIANVFLVHEHYSDKATIVDLEEG